MAYVNLVFTIGAVLPASDLNFLQNNVDTVRISHRGSGPPLSPPAGTHWWDDSSAIWNLKVYNGSGGWIPMLFADTTSLDAGLATPNQKWGAFPMVRRDTTRTQYAGMPTFPRNMLLNPNFQYWQRGSSFNAIAARFISADRWYYELVGGGRVVVNQSSFTPPLAPGDWSLQLTVASARATMAPGDVLGIAQTIEGSVLGRAGYGKGDSRTTHVSFWLWSNVTGQLTFAITGGSGSIKFIAPVTIDTASIWLFKEVHVPAPASGSNWQQKDNRTGAYVGLTFAAHSLYLTTTPSQWTYNDPTDLRTTSGQLNGMNGIGTTFRITGFQWELGEMATPTEVLPENVELQMLQRYYQKSFPFDVKPQAFGTNSLINFMGTFRTSGDGTGYPSSSVRFGVIMRAIPTVTFFNPQTGSAGAWWNSTDNVPGNVATASGYIWREGFHANVVGVPTGGNANDSLHIHYTADAEAVGWE